MNIELTINESDSARIWEAFREVYNWPDEVENSEEFVKNALKNFLFSIVSQQEQQTAVNEAMANLVIEPLGEM